MLAATWLAAFAGASPVAAGDSGRVPPTITHQGRQIDMDGMLESMASARAIVVGEQHDRFDHHLNQLEIIRRLHRTHPELSIGMEQFQQSFQRHLDDYVKGAIDTTEMLIRTQYYERWQHDFRLYEPILSWARDHRLPIIALNLPGELTRRVAAGGLESLDDEQAARLPDLDRSDTAYRERLREVFREHPMGEHGGSFENFYTVQLLWDEGMAARAAKYLEAEPARRMVVLAGNGHVEYGSGIPGRLARRIDGEVISVVNADAGTDDSGKADFVIHSTPVELPERGMLGVMIDTEATADGARVARVNDGGGAAAAGITGGDLITALDGETVRGLAELRARMWDRRPGDRVTVTVIRDGGEPRRLDVTLH